MRSLKQALILWALTAAIALCAGAGLALYLSGRSYMIAQFDSSLTSKARLLASSIEIELANLDLGFQDLDMSEFASTQTGGYLEVWFEDEILYRSPSLGDGDLGVYLDADQLRPQASAVTWVHLPSKRRGRAVTYRFQPTSDAVSEMETPDLAIDGDDPHLIPLPGGSQHNNNGLTLTLRLARDAQNMDQALGALRWALLAIGIGLAILLSITIRYAVSRGLKPLGNLAAHVSQLDERSLNNVLSTDHVPTELMPIVQQFNALLGRLGVAFDREQSFSANIAHELRTPLSGLRMTIDVTRSRQRSVSEYEQCLDQLLDVTEQMQSLVETLLQLTRHDAGQVRPSVDTLSIDALIERLWVTINEQHRDPPSFNVKFHLGATKPIETDSALLTIALTNLLRNAMAYVDDGGTITLETEPDLAGVSIRVINTGSLVEQDERSRVFDRFWRADAARTQTGKHFGLGLTLTRLIVDTLGGSIQADSIRGGDFAITIHLPTRMTPHVTA